MLYKIKVSSLYIFLCISFNCRCNIVAHMFFSKTELFYGFSIEFLTTIYFIIMK